jgi:hypothetical protein
VPSEFSLESLETVAGLAAFIKFICIPVLKKIRPFSGRATILIATAMGIVLSCSYRLSTSPITCQLIITAVLYGITGGWLAVGTQQAVSAIRRPDEA